MAGISNLGQALDQISRLKGQQITLDNFSTQIATGKKTQQFAGLGTDILRSQRARADVNKLEQYSTNITNAHRRISLMTNSVKQIGAQANNLSNALTVAVQGGEGPDFATTQQLATDVYDFIIDLMNSKDGERYLFAGSDSEVKPIEDKGLYDSYLGNFARDPEDASNSTGSGLIDDWGTGAISTEEFIASYHSVSDVVLGYSPALTSGSTGSVSVRVDENSDFDYTMLANSGALKELVAAIGLLKNLPNAENSPGALNDPTLPPNATVSEDIPPFPSDEQQANFYAVFNDIAATIVKAVDKLEKEENRLALVDAQTSLVQESYAYQISTFKSTIAEVENVDLTETIAKIQQVQTNLEASYSVTALISNLSLVNFLN